MKSVKGVLTHFDNPLADQQKLYPDELKSITSLEKSVVAVDQISKWPGYQPTPLHSLGNLAGDIGVDTIWYKDESQRFHLKSFKALGGSYAVARQLQAKVAEATGSTPGIEELLARKFDDIVSRIVISCATDGNHGRSVSWGCQMFGCQCIIYIHRDVSQGRQQAMEALGATVNRTAGNYDESVRQADAEANTRHARARGVPGRRPVPVYFANEPSAGSGRSEELERIVEMLSTSSDVRTDLVDEIRGQIERGEYQTEAKLNFAIYRMLKDILD